MGQKSATGPGQVPDPPFQFRHVYEAEWPEIYCRRREALRKNATPTPSDPQTPPPHLVGLAFSGGGIRSATICLGALQGLNDLKLLPIFDYLSTVSGGGFVGGWWSAWLSRDRVMAKLPQQDYGSVKSGLSELNLDYDPDAQALMFPPQRDGMEQAPTRMSEDLCETLKAIAANQNYKHAVDKLFAQTNDIFPPAEEIEPQRSGDYVSGTANQKLKEGSINAGSDPIHHLRLYANYLTPRKGLLSGDTWLAAAIVSRNLVLTWLILLPVIFAAVMVGRLFFLAGPGTVKLDHPGHATFPYSQAFWNPSPIEVADPAGEANHPAPDYWPEIADRLPFAAALPLSLLLLLGFLTFRWLNTVQVDSRKGGVRALIFAPLMLGIFAFLAYVIRAVKNQGQSIDIKSLLWLGAPFAIGLIGGLITLILHFWIRFGRIKREEKNSKDDAHFRRNIIIREHVHVLQLLVLVSAILVLAGFGHLLIDYVFKAGGKWLRAGGYATLATAIGGWFFTALRASPAAGADNPPKASLPAQVVFAITPVLVLIVLALSAAWLGNLLLETLAPAHHPHVARVFIAINLLCLMIFSIFWHQENKTLVTWGVVAVAVGIILIAALLGASLLFHVPQKLPENYHRPWLMFLVLEIVVTSIVWVIALGWTTDPNWLSLHGFYKVRLIRAYMGASNTNRGARRQDITESATDDDPKLWELRNCQRGAPYHLINTTLNLVGGHDLTTAQRHAAYFTFSKLYCGSVRTGYRDTFDYMSGAMSLGTAVAISGAAASPNMGAKTPSAALAMLMTLNNVRLGYWAPTPTMRAWTNKQARLWPYYTLREFISQTNDLGDYCYLTDGGHFENTALYSLIERGCKYIVLIDCGADPVPPCFADMGDALRRCRMDFGTEIDLRIEPIQGNKKKIADEHWIVGTITYSAEHMEKLDRAREDREGFLIWIKPTLTGDEPADVRQYAIENPNFPQQTTADQWFDEAQFESYRKLGEHIIKDVFEGLPAVKDIKTVSPCLGKTIHAIFEQAQKEADRRQCQREQELKNQRAKADADDNDC